MNPSSSTLSPLSSSESESENLDLLYFLSLKGGLFAGSAAGGLYGFDVLGGKSFLTSLEAAIWAFALVGSFLSYLSAPLNPNGLYVLKTFLSIPWGFLTGYFWGFGAPPPIFESNFRTGSYLGGGRSSVSLTNFFSVVVVVTVVAGLWGYFAPAPPFLFHESSPFLAFVFVNCIY